MKKILIIAVVFCCCSTVTAQQQKSSWFKNYWVSAGTAVLKGTEDEKATVAAFAAMGRHLRHHFLLGAGAGFMNFQNNKKATVLYAYGEKNTGGKNRQLFVYAQPGLAFAYKPQVQLEDIDRFEYWKKQTGVLLQAGAGIKWMVDRHSFYISTGFSKLSYALFTKEYPVPVDPYNPFVEEPLEHRYKFVFSKMILNMGVRF